MTQPCHDTGLDMRLCPCTWCDRIRSITPATIFPVAVNSRGTCPPRPAQFFPKRSDWTSPALVVYALIVGSVALWITFG